MSNLFLGLTNQVLTISFDDELVFDEDSNYRFILRVASGNIALQLGWDEWFDYLARAPPVANSPYALIPTV